MSLMYCKECTGIISNGALSCPHCGAITKHGKKVTKKEKIKRKGNVQGVGCLIIIIAIFLGFSIVGIPFAIILGIIGLIILIAGFFV